MKKRSLIISLMPLTLMSLNLSARLLPKESLSAQEKWGERANTCDYKYWRLVRAIRFDEIDKAKKLIGEKTPEELKAAETDVRLVVQIGSKNDLGEYFLGLVNARFDKYPELVELFNEQEHLKNIGKSSTVRPFSQDLVYTAVKNDDLKMLNSLLKKGLTANKPFKTVTFGKGGTTTKPLDEAIKKGNKAIINLLKEHGAEKAPEQESFFSY